LWTDSHFNQDDNWLNTAAATDAHIMAGITALSVDADAHSVCTSNVNQLGYGRLLFVTGGTPKTLDIPASERVIHFRSFADYRALRHLSGGGSRIAVVGGSYIGTELAAA